MVDSAEFLPLTTWSRADPFWPRFATRFLSCLRCTVLIVNDSLAHERLDEVLALIDRWGNLYKQRWGRNPYQGGQPGLASQVDDLADKLRVRTRLAHDVIAAMGEANLAARVVEHTPRSYSGHPFTPARLAIVEAIAILSQREELSDIVGPAGPRLQAAEFHPVIWGATAQLWDDGHHRAAVQTAASAFEGLLQSICGPGTSGENLAIVFSSGQPTSESPRLRIRGLDHDSKTWRSAHEGAAALVRGAFMGVRNLVAHPGWPDPTPSEALEMLATLSYVTHLVGRAEKVTVP